jgi:hypothetical protein
VHIILGLILIAIGTVITWKGDWLYENFGSIAFFDKYLHSTGGGRFGYKFMGVIGVVIGILVLTNIHVQILTAIANLFLFGNKQK